MCVALGRAGLEDRVFCVAVILHTCSRGVVFKLPSALGKWRLRTCAAFARKSEQRPSHLTIVTYTDLEREQTAVATAACLAVVLYRLNLVSTALTSVTLIKAQTPTCILPVFVKESL